MKRAVDVSFIVLVLLFGSVVQSLSLARGQTENVNYIIKMSVTYSNQSGENQVWNFTESEDDRAIGLFMNTTWQTVELTDSTFPTEAEENDTDGNLVAVLAFPVMELAPGQNITFTSTYHVVSKPRLLPTVTEEDSGVLQDIPTDLIDEYTGEEGPWLTSNSTLRNVAHNVAGSETRVLSIIRRLVVWIHNNIHYPSNLHEVPFYPNETYVSSNSQLNEGDCDDQAILLITLSRILGIPAYLQVGAIYMPTTERELSTYWQDHVEEITKRIGWHGWAMVYVPPWGWLPVDLTYAQGSMADPIKSIKNAAVTSQRVIQYMNITRSDYVASSRQARTFLINNDFYVYLEDEMTEEASQPYSETPSKELFIAGLILAAVILGATSLYMYRKTRKWTEVKAPEPEKDVEKP